jgi:hypothetical protein
LPPLKRSGESSRFGGHSLLIAAALAVLSGSCCLRFGYDERTNPGSAGTGNAGPAPASGTGGGGMAGTSTDSDSREADAGAADGGSVVVSPLCPERPGAAFCDGFEDPEFSRWEYPVSHNGTATRSTAHAHSGTTTLLATTGPPSPLTEARWATVALARQKSGDAWMRFYNWLPSSVVITEYFSVGVMSEIAMPYAGFELRVLPSLVDINSSNGVTPGKVSFPRDRWVCVELHVFIDPIAGVYEAYLDGKIAARSQDTNTVPADGFTAAEVGVHFAGPNQGPVEVYVDDVVVGTARIPCD